MCIRDSPSRGRTSISRARRSTGTTPVSYTHLDVYKRQVQTVTVLRCATPEATGSHARRAEVVGASVALCRDLVNDPPNILTPERFAEVVTRETRGTRTTVTVLDDQALRLSLIHI